MFLLFATLSACSTPDSGPSEAPRPKGEKEEASPETALVIIFHEMAEILEIHPPAEATGHMRIYLNKNQVFIKGVVERLEQTRLELEGDMLTSFVERSGPPLRAALERYAQAQLAFRERASETQKVELQEVLGALQ